MGTGGIALSLNPCRETAVDRGREMCRGTLAFVVQRTFAAVGDKMDRILPAVLIDATPGGEDSLGITFGRSTARLSRAVDRHDAGASDPLHWLTPNNVRAAGGETDRDRCPWCFAIRRLLVGIVKEDIRRVKPFRNKRGASQCLDRTSDVLIRCHYRSKRRLMVRAASS